MYVEKIYDNYSIVSEHSIYLSLQHYNRENYAQFVCYSETNPPLKFFLQERKCNDINYNFYLHLCVGQQPEMLKDAIDSDLEPLAQIILWKWDGFKQEILDNQILCKTQQKLHLDAFRVDGQQDIAALVRFLEKLRIESPLPPLNRQENEVLTIVVGRAPNPADPNAQDQRQSFEVSAHTLMVLSPVFRAMLTIDREVPIPNVDPEEFCVFLAAISPTHLMMPNPTNVRSLLAMARCYQVQALKVRCEDHLMHCVEIPLIELIQLAYGYQLNKLMFFLLDSFEGGELREFCNANREVFNAFNAKILQIVLDFIALHSTETAS